jgi:hypothetical protein
MGVKNVTPQVFEHYRAISVFRWQNSNKERGELRTENGKKAMRRERYASSNTSNNLCYGLCWIVKLLTSLKNMWGLDHVRAKVAHSQYLTSGREGGGVQFVNVIGASPLKISFCDSRTLRRKTVESHDVRQSFFVFSYACAVDNNFTV